MEYERRKSLRRTFWHLAVSETDLARIGTLIRGACDPERFQVDVRSGDGQDSYRTSDPDFLSSEAMPQEVSVVMITGSSKVGALRCDLELRASVDGRAELTVSGGDVTTASGLFHELVHELEKRQLPGRCAVRPIDSVFVYLALAVLSGLAVYSAFDLPLNLAASYINGFRDSTVHKTLQGLGWVCVAIAFGSGGFNLHDRVKALFPAVQFSGRLRDPSTKRRRRVVQILAIVLLPILLNVLANVLTGLMKTWRTG